MGDIIQKLKVVADAMDLSNVHELKRVVDEFKESEHPREESGRFGEKGSGGGEAKTSNSGQWTMKSNKETKDFYTDQNRHYLPEREAIHDSFLIKYQHRKSQINPVVALIAGGTASGKTYCASVAHSNLRDPAIVNMDTPRSQLPEFKQVMGTNKCGLLQEESSDIRDKLLMSAAAHNNDVALDAVGSPQLAAKLDALERAGYRVTVSYVHTPILQSLRMAENRSKTATDPADKRVVPNESISASHEKARRSLHLLVKPGREIKIFDNENFVKSLIYHRTADGVVKMQDNEALGRLQNAEGESPVGNIF